MLWRAGVPISGGRGGYVYLREAFGSQTAFLYGWMSLIVMDPGITSTDAKYKQYGYKAHMNFSGKEFKDARDK